MKCPFCKEEIERFTTECSACSERIPKIYSYIDYAKEIISSPKAKKVFKYGLLFTVIVLIAGVIVYNILAMIKPPECDSEFAKQEVLNAYKHESSIFRAYEINNIPEKYRANVVFSEPELLNYDKKTKKYSCKAKVTLSPQKNETNFISAILQGEEIWDTKYSKIQGLVYVLFNSTASCNTEYEIYKNKSKNELKTKICNNSDFWGENWKQSESWNWFALNENAQKEYEKAQAEEKIKKALSDYEIVAEIYMVESEEDNLYGLVGYNCENLKDYFKMSSQDSACSFTSPNGIYWKFNSDGSATISEKKENPVYRVKVGVCNNGYINCPYNYPEAHKLKGN